MRQYYGGKGYDGYWIEIPNEEYTQNSLYIPMRGENIRDDKENLVITYFMLGEELFYGRLSQVVEDLGFADFCHITELEIESYEEKAEDAEEVNLKK